VNIHVIFHVANLSELLWAGVTLKPLDDALALFVVLKDLSEISVVESCLGSDSDSLAIPHNHF